MSQFCHECHSRAPMHAADCSAIQPPTPISPEVKLINIPAQLRILADRMDAAQNLEDGADMVLLDVDICLVVMTSPKMARGMVHAFGRRPSAFEAQGLLFSAAVRVP